MRKCTYCGREYPDGALRCLVDEQLLTGGEPSLPLAVAVPGENVPPIIAETSPGMDQAERRTRMIELALVCAVAFGGSILVSTYDLIFPRDEASRSWGALGWLNSGLHEIIALAVLWYVLGRRAKSWIDLGFRWSLKDCGMSVPLFIIAGLASSGMYVVLEALGLAPTGRSYAIKHVEHILFSSGVSWATMLFQFLNPFYEELIARAYVMTEVKQISRRALLAILISTALQTSYHFYQGVPLALSSGALFLVFSLYYAKTNRILPVILAHLYFDVSATLFYWARTS